ncbi:MAG TPA: DUF4435 domain-containing protein [Burkholderiaceae bacterium]
MHQIEGDVYLARTKESLSASAVLKTQFALLKSACSTVKIFAYEGVSDKDVYYHWIKMVNDLLVYETFICKNKPQLLQLFDLLLRDKTGLGDGVYFFVDRDFDDFLDRELSGKVFLTDKYSVENYLVNGEVLEDLLRNELHCHGAPVVRKTLSELFEKMYDEFLEVTAEINFRIYVARKLGIRQIRDIPLKLALLADVHLDSIDPANVVHSEFVVLEREPTEQEMDHFRNEFSLLDRRARFRGKFGLLFFTKWLRELKEDRNCDQPIYFRELPQGEIRATASMSFETLVGKSKPPVAFFEFLASVV